MIVLSFGVAVGALLSLWFNVVILIPSICLALMIVGIGGIAQGDGVRAIVGLMGVITASIQAGYLVGGALASRASRSSSRGRASLPTEISRPV